MNMPRLDGVEAARRLRALQPTLPIALHSSDPELLRQRAAGLGLPLFDKIDFDRLLAWVEQQANASAAGGPHASLRWRESSTSAATCAATASSAVAACAVRCAAGTQSGPSRPAGGRAEPRSMNAEPVETSQGSSAMRRTPSGRSHLRRCQRSNPGGQVQPTPSSCSAKASSAGVARRSAIARSSKSAIGAGREVAVARDVAPAFEIVGANLRVKLEPVGGRTDSGKPDTCSGSKPASGIAPGARSKVSSCQPRTARRPGSPVNSGSCSAASVRKTSWTPTSGRPRRDARVKRARE